jgi:general secretion pathway protein E
VPAQSADDLPTHEDLGDMGASNSGRWMSAVGCEHCRGTGYAGRFALGESLNMTPEMKSLLARRASLIELQDEALKSGWVALRTLALTAASQGQTTMEEVNRVAS